MVYSVGSILCLIYVLLEMRIDPKKLGQSTVLCVTIGLVFNGLAQYPAYAPLPIPPIAIENGFFILILTTLALPPAGLFLKQNFDQSDSFS